MASRAPVLRVLPRPAAGGRPVGHTRDEKEKVRQIFNEVFRKSRPEIVAALTACFTSPETVLACLELLARLEGELP